MDTTQLQDRLTALEQTLEQAVARLTTQQEKIVSIIATVDTSREADLLQRLEAAEANLAELKSAAAANNPGRKTLPTGVTNMLAKQGISLEHTSVALEASAVDAALANLSIEQRIAVKSELMRSGLLG